VTRYLRSFANRETLGQVMRVGLIGGFNTIVYFAIFNVLFGHLSVFWAITIAFGLATGLSYVLNRRWSFKISDGSVGNARESWTFYLVNLGAWGVTVAIVAGAEAMLGELSQLEANLAAVVATGVVIIPKFAAYRDVVFRRSLQSGADPDGDPQASGPSPTPTGPTETSPSKTSPSKTSID